MKKQVLILLFTLLSINLTAQVVNYEVGEVVNDFTGTDTDGNVHNLYEITASGKYVFLDFFFDTCLPCQTKAQYFTGLYNKYGCNSGEVYCLSVNNGTDMDEEVIAFTEEFGGPGQHNPAISGDGGSWYIKNDFGIAAYPTFCVIGPDNRLVTTGIWPVNSVEELEAAFPDGFNPDPMPCSVAGLKNLSTTLKEFTVYPNPAKESAELQFFSEVSGEVQIQLLNLEGKVIFANTKTIQSGVNKLTYDLKAIENGTYIVNIQLGYAILNKKIVIYK